MKNKFDAIVIGSGAAAYACADRLFEAGVTDIAVITEGRLCGTSRNTGSDKQTYYKLSLDGITADSPYKMAQDICAAGCCDGEKAYLQAVNSIPCFLHLCDSGVNFPRDEYGGFPGYQTDHDSTRRATSIGPLTSRVMTEQLEKTVIEKNKTPIFDGRQVVKIITEGSRACGVLTLNESGEFEAFAAKNVVCATGAPACIYASSVYPRSQHGMTGVLIAAGVSLCNFSQWQYGLSSTDFRWNVSGSFMQVVPKFISIDQNGGCEEFLLECFESPSEMCTNIFLKGYQWPFSFERMNASSQIDVAVHEQIKQGKKVFLDFTENPTGFDLGELDETVQGYLAAAGCKGETPIQRLESLNPKAIDIYSANGIDLFTQPLRIAVCAQHNNGGVLTDINGQTDIQGLYVIGEAAGNFGIARPGGSALNDTQVGALLAAKHIAQSIGGEINLKACEKALEWAADFKKRFTPSSDVNYAHIPEKMSRCCSFLREKEKCVELLNEITRLIEGCGFTHKSMSDYFYDLDMLLSAQALLETVVLEMSETGSRGGAVFIESSRAAEENPYYRDFLTVTREHSVYFKKTSPIPYPDKAFEKYL